MYRNLWLLALVACLFVPFAGCSSDDDDDNPPPPPPPFGPSAIAVGDNALIMVSGDMMSWVNVTQVESTLPALGDLLKVVRVPNHASGRLVVIVDRTDTTDSNAEIWYNDAGGTGAWTKASYGAVEANLDPRHRATGTEDDWGLRDIFFVNSTEGYAVGDYSVVLRTYDAGATWYDLNAYTPATPIAGSPVYLDVSNIGGTGSFAMGGIVTGAPSGATGTIVSWDSDDFKLIVTLNTATLFTSADTIAQTTPATTADVDGVYNTWLHDTEYLLSVYAVEAADFSQTIFFGTYSTNDLDGVWRLTTNTTSGAGRTFVWNAPPVAQSATVGGSTTNGLFFFNGTTGVAGTDDGVWYTTDGIVWADWAVTTTDDFYSFCYSQSDQASSGYLWSVNGWSNIPGRVSVTFTAPGTWAFDAVNGWVEHGTAANVDLYYIDGSSSIFLYGSKIFVAEDSDDEWGWGYDANNAVLNDTMWTDTNEMNLGGTLANGTNEAYDHGFLDAVGAPAGTIRSMCKR